MIFLFYFHAFMTMWMLLVILCQFRTGHLNRVSLLVFAILVICWLPYFVPAPGGP